MLKTASALPPLLAAMFLGPTLASRQDQATSTGETSAATVARTDPFGEHVLATVNGTPIGEADIHLALRSSAHNQEFPPGYRRNVLEVIIQREVTCQRAVELGLEANPTYQEKLRRMEAQINAFKREELSKLFWRRITGTVGVSDAEAKEYFAENAPRIRTELHVWQILVKKESVIEQALNDLKEGTPFEEIARRQFPNLPKAAGRPWDLGYLRWKQVPEAWRNVVYDLKTGEVSGAIRGPNNRFWIIMLIDKRENQDITFERVKPAIMEIVRSAKIKHLRDKTERELRAQASIVYSDGPARAPHE